MNKEIIFGIKPLEEAILAGKEIDKVLMQKTMHPETASRLISLIHKYRIPLQKVPVEKLNHISKKNHQGVIAFVSAINFASLDAVISDCYSTGKEPLILVLDRVTDVRNFGAIVRTAECAGVDAIVIPAKGSAALNADAMKTSAGALNHIPVCRESKLKDTLKELRANGLRIVAMTEKTKNEVYNTDLTGPVAMVMGSEEDGVSQDLLQISDELCRIPLFGKINSLNVSVSAAIGIYEIVRQRNL